MNPVETAQAILDGPWRHMPAARQACQRGEWKEFVHKSMPKPPLLVGRRDHARCVAIAEDSLSEPAVSAVQLLPAWCCQSWESEETEWVAIHCAAWVARPLAIVESGPFLQDSSPRADMRLECKVRRWSAATVVSCSNYAPNFPLKLRSGAFGVLEIELTEVLQVEIREGELIPRPNHPVPMFSCWCEPRVRLPTETEAEIRALSYTASGDQEEVG